MKKYIIYSFFLLCSGLLSAQIEDGSIAPNFTVTDVNDETHELFEYLQDGYTVVIYFMATWNDDCWNYHNGGYNGTDGVGALEVLHNEHGVANGGEVIVLMIEIDPNTNLECLIGGPGCDYTTHGDWSQDTPYPVINDEFTGGLYQIGSVPLVMTICPNGFVTETGTMTADGHWDFIESSSCPDLLENDAALQYEGDTSTSCDDSEVIISLANLGTNNLTSVNIVSEGGTPVIDYNWEGDLGSFDTEEINLGFIEVNEGEILTLTITNEDENPDNNSIAPIVAAPECSTHIHLELQSDTYPEDFSFFILDELGNTIVADGDWGDLGADALIERDYFLLETGCYQVYLVDSYGDGLFEGAYCLAYGIDGDGNDMSYILNIAPGEFSQIQAGANVNQILTLDNDAALEFEGSYAESCNDLELIVSLMNFGQDNLTNVHIESEGCTPAIDYNWEGDLETADSENINLGLVEINEGEVLTLNISTEDEDLANNGITPIGYSTESTNHIRLELQSDTYPEDFSFVIRDENGVTVVSDGDWGSLGADALIVRDYYLEETGCYQVYLFDSYGDGLIVDGSYCLVYGIDEDGNEMNHILNVQPSEFAEVIARTSVNQIVVNIPTIEEDYHILEIFPNPTNDLVQLEFGLSNPGKAKVELISPRGDVVLKESLGNLSQGQHQFRVDVSNVASGIYMIYVQCGDVLISERVRIE